MRNSQTVPRLVTLALLLAIGGTLAYWGILLLAPRPAIAPSQLGLGSNAPPNLTPAALLFGSTTPNAPVAETPTNIDVAGVLQAGVKGVAVMTVNGKVAVVGVGDRIDERTVLKSVSVDKVVIEQSGRTIELRSPLRPNVDLLTSARNQSARTGPGGGRPFGPMSGQSGSMPPATMRYGAGAPPSRPIVPPQAGAGYTPPAGSSAAATTPPPAPNYTPPNMPPQYTPPQASSGNMAPGATMQPGSSQFGGAQPFGPPPQGGDGAPPMSMPPGMGGQASTLQMPPPMQGAPDGSGGMVVPQ